MNEIKFMEKISGEIDLSGWHLDSLDLLKSALGESIIEWVNVCTSAAFKVESAWQQKYRELGFKDKLEEIILKCAQEAIEYGFTPEGDGELEFAHFLLEPKGSISPVLLMHLGVGRECEGPTYSLNLEAAVDGFIDHQLCYIAEHAEDVDGVTCEKERAKMIGEYNDIDHGENALSRLAWQFRGLADKLESNLPTQAPRTS